MIKVELRKPDGVIKNLPSDADIQEMLYKELSYWQDGSGDASIFFWDDSVMVKTSLIIIPSNDGKFYLEHINKNERTYNPHVSISGDNSDEVYIACVGGEDHPLPKKSFVSRDTALTAINYFLLNGGRSQSISWARRTEMKWPSLEDDEELEE